MLDVSRVASILPSSGRPGTSRAPRCRRARFNDRADDRVVAMTLALPRAGERAIRSIDLSRPVMVLLALLLCGLVLLPLGWLVWYSVTDNERRVDRGQFRAPGDRSELREPYLTALEIAASVALAAAAAALPLAWLVARTDLPLRRLDPRPGHRLVRDPALSRRDRLGNPRRTEQRHPQPVRPRVVRARRIRAYVQHLHRTRRRLHDGLLQLSVCLRADRQRARQYSGRSRGRLGDPRRRPLRVRSAG